MTNEEDTSIRTLVHDTNPPLALEIPGVTMGAELGRGGMAVVYAGSDRGFNPPRRVAVKLLNPNLSSDDEFRSRFEREASIVAGFRHDNIVRIYSSSQVDATRFIVMEYLDGGTLESSIQRRALDAVAAIEIAVALADALAYAHARGVVHRDVKPSNVLFTADGKPVLTDFGVARLISAEHASMTRDAKVIGAPRYMSPEQERGERVDGSADVYAFGLVLYEMLTGYLPPLRWVSSSEDRHLLAKSMNGAAERQAQLVADCLNPDPRARPTALDCRQRLAVDAAPRRNWLLVATAVAASVGIAGVVVLFALRAPQANPTAVAVPAVTVRTEPTPRVLAVTPAEAVVYLDGEPAKVPVVLPADARAHELAVVSPGYAGQIVVRESGDSTPVQLAMLGNPSLAEHQTFADQFFDRANSGESAAVITHAPLLRLLLLKSLASTQNPRLQEEIDSTRRLADYGDVGSQFVMFVAGSEKLTPMDEPSSQRYLQRAIDGGYGLASFYRALQQMASTRARGESFVEGGDAYRRFKGSLDLAAAQGVSDIVADFRAAMEQGRP